ncbi:hypothetical protein I4U23_010029 [Adineta vaga]|nr:hypothetical protein I4U23_010029 [Adineta vaga]
MSPSPKSPEEKKQPDEENPSNDELPHPPFHMHHEHIASTDESAANSDNDEHTPNQHMENTNGYCLLPQEIDMNQQEDENEDDEFRRFATLRVLSSTDEVRPTSTTNPPIESIWSAKLESESFPVDDDKANYIKQLMSSIKLPESSIPMWAQYCSEQDWQAKLREKIMCRQTTFFVNDKQ